MSRRGRSSVGGESGMVTAEAALAMGALVPVLLAVLAGVQVGVAHLQVADAARTAARAAARGDDSARVAGLVGATAPGASVEIERTAEQVVVVVSRSAGPGPLRGLLVRSRAVAAAELGGPRLGVGVGSVIGAE